MEEAAVVAELVGDLMGRPWRAGGRERVMGQADVLVVTPYNAQVNQVRSALAAAGLGGVEVGTVDKFQGREAAVAVFSLAASSGAHVPRRLEFLLDRHRLNVALSRAKTVAYLVGSPALLTSPAHTPEQLRLVNGLCRLVEVATGTPRRPGRRVAGGRGTPVARTRLRNGALQDQRVGAAGVGAAGSVRSAESGQAVPSGDWLG
ncbi:hypothetical protein A7K94_0216615 [Modestobacter sp. VKM Ac-2676]|nr:hypothetical protein A7K94_0216615 [Modestobacter sp. VKM Ac-2676]